MDLIDKDKLDSFKFRSASERMDLPVDYMVGWNDAVDGIMCNAPTVDAEPVIRCKDCKYSVDEYDDGECYCDYEKDLRYIKDWDHYCSWAEGKEE